MARSRLPHSGNPPGAMAPPLLKFKNSTLLNTTSASDCAPSTQVLLLSKSSREQKVPQPKASADHNIPETQKAIGEVDKRFLESIDFTKTHWPDIIRWQVLDSWTSWHVAVEAQDCQRASAGAPVGTPSVSQLRSGPFGKITPQTQDAVTSGFSLMLPYQISNIDYTQKYA